MTTYTIATDLSAESRAAAGFAATLAARTHARLDWFCALPRDVVAKYRIDPERVRDLLERLAARHGKTGVRTTAHVAVAQDVPAAILERARDSRASLVVVAPHGATAWKKVLLGSVAQRVLREASTSVLVARAATESASGPVVAGVDLGPSAEPVMRHAVALARAVGADLEVVHVVPPVEILVPLVGMIPVERTRLDVPARELALRVEGLAHRGVRISTRVFEGSPAETLVGHARRAAARLVVVGATTKSRMRRAFLGSVALGVAAACTTSVLVLRWQQFRERPDAAASPSRSSRRRVP